MTTTTTTITASKVAPTWSKELVKVTAVEKFADCLLLRWMTAEQVVKEADGDMSGDIDLDEFSDLCLNTLRLPLRRRKSRKSSAWLTWTAAALAASMR